MDDRKDARLFIRELGKNPATDEELAKVQGGMTPQDWMSLCFKHFRPEDDDWGKWIPGWRNK